MYLEIEQLKNKVLKPNNEVIIIDFNNLLEKNKYLVHFVTDIILKENKKVIGINFSYLTSCMMKKIIKENESSVKSNPLFVDIKEFNLKDVKDKCIKLNKVNNIDIVIINQTFIKNFMDNKEKILEELNILSKELNIDVILVKLNQERI